MYCRMAAAADMEPHPLHVRVAGVVTASCGNEVPRHGGTAFLQHVLYERQVLCRRAAPVSSHACTQDDTSSPRCLSSGPRDSKVC